jgi:hypothetical protein
MQGLVLKKDDYNGSCKLCNSNICVKSDGFGAIKKYMKTKEHQGAIKGVIVDRQTKIDQVFDSNKTKQLSEITCAEISLVYHTIKHHHSYNSSDCGNKLYSTLFPDSEIAKNIHLGRTKSLAIAENVLSPFSIGKHVKTLVDSNQKFSISHDASNKKISSAFLL